MKSLQQLEREYFIKQSGLTNQKIPLNQMKRLVFAALLGDVNPQTPFLEMESRWMIKVIRTAGITPSNELSPATLWKEMVMSLGLTPKKTINENKVVFYFNA